MIDDDEALSNCCGVAGENDQGICPQCKEHCEFLTQEQENELEENYS